MPAGLEHSGPVFDRATRLARSLFGPVEAMITLEVEGGYWRSRAGVAAGSAVGVQEVMRLGDVVWIDDCAEDPRVRDEPVVTGPPHLRFFAGAPIRLEDGSTPGALWVVGLAPRPHDPCLARRLQDLADFAADEWSRVRARQARSAYERTLRSVIDAMPTSMVLTDREHRVLYASPVWLKARGLEAETALGRTLFELKPELFEPWREGLERCMAGQPISIDRLRLPSGPGQDGWVKVEVVPWRDDRNDIGGLIITSYDITGVVEALERSERSEERLTLAMQLADLHVFEVDYQRGELIKAGAEDTFFDKPKSYEDMLADPWAAIDPRDREAVQAIWRAHLSGEGPLERPEYRMARGDGREVWAAGATRMICDEQGRPARLLGVMQNITARKTAERALVQAKEDAEAANRAKSAFLATMSHEIRTPLNGVLGMAQAMAADELAPVQRERVDVIRHSGESLLAILNDVLDLSKVEAGKLELENAQFEVAAVARTVHATFSAIAEAKGLDFELTVDRAAHGVYEGDQVRVRQILWNLVSNALKFTERGGVKVKVFREGGALSLTVMDSGIGMTPSQLEGLFRKFEQADASTTRRFGGTGLGLAICRELAQLMGGAISATSAPGRGSTFTVSLPLKKVARAAPKPKRAVKRTSAPIVDRPIRVLAAEDNAMNQLVLKTLLGQVGIEPVIVPDGREAVAAWEREPWDVILMDVQMPVMDGPTATALIRTRERAEGRPRTPIVALTANAMSHQVGEYLQSGMDAFVAKPIEAARLYEALQAAVAGDEAPATAAA